MSEQIVSSPDFTRDLDYLLNIQETSDGAARVRELIAQGCDSRTIARMCDETGQLTYEHPPDPRAAVNRLYFFDVRGYETVPSGNETGDIDHVLWDKDTYFPSAEAIRWTRELVRKTLDGESRPTLNTHEDFIEYFSQFHPDVLRELFTHLFEFQLTDGCNGPCRSVCGMPVKTRAKRHIPFSTIYWIFQNFGHLWRNDEKDDLGNPTHLCQPALYGASDIIDYHDGDKTGVDVIKALLEAKKAPSYVSIAYRLDRDAIEFMYRALAEDVPIHRISRLTSGRKDDALAKLLDALKKRAMRDGRTLEPRMINQIELAFESGSKEGCNIVMGNAITHDTREEDMATWQMRCAHGVSLSHEGFAGVVLRPVSGKFPYGAVTYPICPGDNRIAIPNYSWMEDSQPPFTSDANWLILRPRFTVFDGDGKEISRDAKTRNERRIVNMTTLRKDMMQWRRSWGIFKYYSEKTEVSVEELLHIEEATRACNEQMGRIEACARTIRDVHKDEPDTLEELLAVIGVIPDIMEEVLFPRMELIIQNLQRYLESKDVSNPTFRRQRYLSQRLAEDISQCLTVLRERKQLFPGQLVLT